MKAFLIFTFVTAAMLHVSAAGVKSKTLSKDEIVSSLFDQGMDKQTAEAVIQALSKAEKQSKSGLSVSSYLLAGYFNGALLVDKDNLQFDVTMKTQDQQIATIKNLVGAKYSNPGLKIELGYKWVLVFLTNGLDVNQLTNAECGRGVSLQLPALGLIGIEAGWLPCKNLPGSAIIVSPIIGLMGGLSFPKLNFTRNTIQ